jgi:hypothetical protein
LAATVKIFRWTSTSGAPVKTDITSATNRAATADDPAPGNANPIPVPTADLNYSYWVCTRLSATAAPATAINNIKWYSDGTNSMGTGVSLKVATASAYAMATGTPGTTGTALTSAGYGAGWSFSQSAASGAFNFASSGTMLTVTGSIGSATGDFGDFVVYQVEVSSSAGPGVTTAETLTWQYDQT